MYPTGGGNAYGQQPYASQHGYGQSVASGYHGTSTLSPDSLRHSAMAGGHQDAHMGGGYRGLPSSGALGGGYSAPLPTQYGAHYGTAYGASQLDVVGGNGVGLSALQDRAGGSKFSSSDIGSNLGLKTADYIPSSDYGYGRKIDQFAKGKVSDYPLDRSHYIESQSTYIGRDLPSESARTYSDYASLSHQYQSDLRDQASLLHHQQLLPTESDVRQSLSASALDTSMRPSGYLAARTGATRHGSQDPAAYGTRMDADARGFSALGGGSYAGQHPASVLGTAGRSNLEDLYHTHGPSGAGYGVGLPPGRDYSTGKGLGNVLDYPGGASSHSGHLSIGGPRLEDRKDDRGILRREFEIREEDRRKDHAREREKERERERERERDRERERERERERARLLERREERDRERKREREVRRDRTPPRMTRDHQGSKERFLRKDSTRHEVTHRRHSPLKERRRDYICKAYPFRLVETERDFMSITKRYPRLVVSPEFCKLIIYWPNHNLNVSFHTPVSFEHELVEVHGNLDQEQPSAAPNADENSWTSCGVKTIWKAKVILMSGISDDAFQDLSSKKNLNDRIPHYNNILRFVVLKKDRCFMAIGGCWNSEVDGGDPSVDDTALIRTAIRHTKEITQLDLHSCIHWNRFLEIHYDRVGKDGLFSHREISVYFIPNLLECLPSLDVWRTQWLSHRQVKLERDQPRLKKEKCKSVGRSDVKGNISVGKPEDGDSAETEKKMTMNLDVKKQTEDVDAETTFPKDKSCESIREEENIDKQKKSESSQVLKTVADRKEKSANGDQKANELKDENNQNEEPADFSSAKETAVRQSGKKRIVRKVVTKKGVKGQVAPAEDKGESADGAEDGNKGSETVGKVVPKEQSELDAKKVGKKKIIKKAVKRKVVTKTEKATDVASDNHDNKVGAGEESTGKKQEKTEEQDGHANEKKNGSNSKIVLAEGKDEVAAGDEEDTTNKASLVEKEDGLSKEGDANKNDTQPNTDKLKRENDKTKDEEESIEIKDNSTKETKDKQGGSLERHPPYPGFFLETKVSKELKLRSTSFSLEGLLDYSEKDTEESTFELSVFAEVLCEMLQYQMGCHILAYLEGLHLLVVKKRNAHKRSRDEDPDEVNGDGRSKKKHSKFSDRPPAENDSSKPGLTLESDVNTEGILAGESASEHDGTENADNTELEMKDADPSDVGMPERGDEDKMVDSEGDAKKGDSVGGTSADKMPNLEEHKVTIENKKALSGKADDMVKEPPCIDKELLQAFRFFDRNRVGYVKVEDLRTIIHSLGKFLSNRQVKELVHCALLETNTSRDNRIFYEKLVALSDS